MVRRFVQAPSKICFPFPNAFYRLFTRRIREKYPKVFRNVPSGVPGQIFRGKEMHLFLHYCKTHLLIQFFYLFVLSSIILFCLFVCFLPTYSTSLEDILLKSEGCSTKNAKSLCCKAVPSAQYHCARARAKGSGPRGESGGGQLDPQLT